MKTKLIKNWTEFYSYDRASNWIAFYIILIIQNYTGRQINHKLQIRNKGIHPLSA